MVFVIVVTVITSFTLLFLIISVNHCSSFPQFLRPDETEFNTKTNKLPASLADRVNQQVQQVLNSLRLYRTYTLEQDVRSKNFGTSLSHGSSCTPTLFLQAPSSQPQPQLDDNDLLLKMDQSPSISTLSSEPDDCMKSSITVLTNPIYSTALICDPIQNICLCLVRLPHEDGRLSENGKCLSSEGLLCNDHTDCRTSGQLQCIEKRQHLLSSKSSSFNGLGKEYEYADEEIANEDRFCTSIGYMSGRIGNKNSADDRQEGSDGGVNQKVLFQIPPILFVFYSTFYHLSW